MVGLRDWWIRAGSAAGNHAGGRPVGQIRERVEVKERVPVTTLTKRHGGRFRSSRGVYVYLHSDIDTVERRNHS